MKETRAAIGTPEAPAERTSKVDSPDASLAGTETILVADDEPPVRSLCARLLKRYGYTVIEASSVSEAELRFEGHAGPIHLLLSDLTMSDGTGAELADRLAARSPLAVVLMSGYPESSLGRPLGSYAYLQKPFSSQDLAARVRQVLDSLPRALRS